MLCDLPHVHFRIDTFFFPALQGYYAVEITTLPLSRNCLRSKVCASPDLIQWFLYVEVQNSGPFIQVGTILKNCLSSRTLILWAEFSVLTALTSPFIGACLSSLLYSVLPNNFLHIYQMSQETWQDSSISCLFISLIITGITLIDILLLFISLPSLSILCPVDEFTVIYGAVHTSSPP